MTYLVMYADDEGSPLRSLIVTGEASACDGMEEATQRALEMREASDVKVFKLVEIAYYKFKRDP